MNEEPARPLPLPLPQNCTRDFVEAWTISFPDTESSPISRPIRSRTSLTSPQTQCSSSVNRPSALASHYSDDRREHVSGLPSFRLPASCNDEGPKSLLQLAAGATEPCLRTWLGWSVSAWRSVLAFRSSDDDPLFA